MDLIILSFENPTIQNILIFKGKCNSLALFLIRKSKERNCTLYERSSLTIKAQKVGSSYLSLHEKYMESYQSK